MGDDEEIRLMLEVMREGGVVDMAVRRAMLEAQRQRPEIRLVEVTGERVRLEGRLQAGGREHGAVVSLSAQALRQPKLIERAIEEVRWQIMARAAEAMGLTQAYQVVPAEEEARSMHLCNDLRRQSTLYPDTPPVRFRGLDLTYEALQGLMALPVVPVDPLREALDRPMSPKRREKRRRQMEQEMERRTRGS